MSTTKVSAALMEAGTKGADIASTGTMVIGTDGSYFDITGTTGITAMTVDAGRIFTLQFDGAVTLTHSSTLYLAGAANFTTEANDHLTFVAVAANDVRQIGAGLKDGGSPVAAGGGIIVQVVHVQNGAVVTGTTIHPIDDTIPQITEGDEYMTLAITPTNASNKLLIEVSIHNSHSAAISLNSASLFQDTTANALATNGYTSEAANRDNIIVLTHYMAAGTTSSTTFKVRMGGHVSGTTTMSGSGGARKWGGVCASTITITEIEV
jgi:hypothetical protein